MEYRNHTPYPSIAFPSFGKDDKTYHVVVLKQSFEIQDNQTLKGSPNQQELFVQDKFSGEINKSSLIHESDLVPFKPKCDVIFQGKAYSPNGKSAPHFEVGIKIENSDKSLLEKILQVSGPRFWKKKLVTGWSLTKPEPISSLPLTYENAYGGFCRINKDEIPLRRIKKEARLTPEQIKAYPDGPEKAPLAYTIFDQNPVGKGFAEDWYLKAKKPKEIPAPQVESPDDPIAKFKQEHSPESFGVITKSWEPRRQLAGTYDDQWLKTRHPYLPNDFDENHWNAAHPDMQIPHLNGNETVHLHNLSSRGDLSFQLPGNLVFSMIRKQTGEMLPYPMNLDTLFLEPDENRVSLTWRLRILDEPPIRVIEARMASHKDPEMIENLSNTMEVLYG